MRHAGSCHCGKIAFEVDADLVEAIDCNCSMCRRRGGLLAFVPYENFSLLTPRTDVSTYVFNKHLIQHHFCNVCGIAPFGEGDGKDGRMAAVNIRCLPEVDLDAIKVVKFDGKQF